MGLIFSFWRIGINIRHLTIQFWPWSLMSIMEIVDENSWIFACYFLPCICIIFSGNGSNNIFSTSGSRNNFGRFLANKNKTFTDQYHVFLRKDLWRPPDKTFTDQYHVTFGKIFGVCNVFGFFGNIGKWKKKWMSIIVLYLEKNNSFSSSHINWSCMSQWARFGTSKIFIVPIV